jgi:periplasmic protein TonB
MKKLLFVLLIPISAPLFAQNDTSQSTNLQIADSVFTKVEVESYFPGGEKLWNKYVQSKIEKALKEIFKDNKSNGTCEVQFIVDKDGSVINVEALTLTDSYLANVFVRAIKESPKWVPAYQFGKPVKSWRRQKVTIKIR